jgi:hypothetical protein
MSLLELQLLEFWQNYLDGVKTVRPAKNSRLFIKQTINHRPGGGFCFAAICEPVHLARGGEQNRLVSGDPPGIRVGTNQRKTICDRPLLENT